MNKNVIITCAVTGAGDSWARHPDLPVTPPQIADAVISAAKAGAAVAHIHVRDPKSGKGARDAELYQKVVELVRGSDTDVIINLTAGMGGAWFPDEDKPSFPGPGTDMVGPEERLAHVEVLRPDICSLDFGTMNFGDNEIFISTPQYLWAMAEMIQSWGVKPELEVFDLGQFWFALVSMISVATTYDSASYTLASTATWELKEGDDPARWHRLFWAGVLGLLPILMMWVGGLQIIRSGCLLPPCHCFLSAWPWRFH